MTTANSQQRALDNPQGEMRNRNLRLIHRMGAMALSQEELRHLDSRRREAASHIQVGGNDTSPRTQPRLARSGALVLGFLIFTEGADGQPMLFGQIEGDAVQLVAPLIGRLEVMDIGTEAALILRGLANRVAHRLGLASPVINLQLGDERLPVR